MSYRTWNRTWTLSTISIVIVVAISYAIWFNFLDSANYCEDPNNREHCVPIGKIFNGNNIYQPWNIIGHFIPGLFLALFSPKKLELFIAGALISTVIMDSPLWGVMKLAHNLPLWNKDGNTWNLWEWVKFYYNPVGQDQVWADPWLFKGFPTSAVIFWSLVARIVGAVALIRWQQKQEDMGERRSLAERITKRTKAQK